MDGKERKLCKTEHQKLDTEDELKIDFVVWYELKWYHRILGSDECSKQQSQQWIHTKCETEYLFISNEHKPTKKEEKWKKQIPVCKKKKQTKQNPKKIDCKRKVPNVIEHYSMMYCICFSSEQSQCSIFMWYIDTEAGIRIETHTQTHTDNLSHICRVDYMFSIVSYLHK